MILSTLHTTPLMRRPRTGTIRCMGIRDRLKNSVRSLVDRFSGEYSSASGEVRQDDPPPEDHGNPQAEVKVTRARLKRPRDAKESGEG